MSEKKITFGERIKEQRQRRRWTMEELAGKVEMAKSSIAGYESENRQPPIHLLAKFAEVFKVSTDYLLGLTDDPDPKKEQKNVREFLEKKDVLHWDDEPLTDQELKPIRDMLAMVMNERMNNPRKVL